MASTTEWMARNGVASNLLMLVFVVGGLFILGGIRQEVFPSMEMAGIHIEIPYPGASPDDVEKGVLLVVEEVVQGIDGVKKVHSQAKEGVASLDIELYRSADKNDVSENIKNLVEAISSFPVEIEKPIVSIITQNTKVLTLMVYGDQSATHLRDLAEMLRAELQNKDGITQVTLSNPQALEISIEIPHHVLRGLNLTLNEVALLIRNNSRNISGGSLRTQAGEILVRTLSRKTRGGEFANIPIISNEDGVLVTLGDIAIINDGFYQADTESFYDGKPAIKLDIYGVGDETPISVATSVKDYIRETLPRLPSTVNLAIFEDQSVIFEERMDLLLKNALFGLVLVLLIIGLFIEPKLAFWVMLGLPVSFLGSFIFFDATNATINMISMFAFIITIGIVVDDAVIVGESIYNERKNGLSNLEASIKGVQLMAAPITFAVLTNIAAFMPMFFIPGPIGDVFKQVPAVVVSVLIVSLVETLYVLPAHLSHDSKPSKFWWTLSAPQRYFSAALETFGKEVFSPILSFAVRNRYSTIACGVAMLLICVGSVRGGYIQFSFIPKMDSDVITAQATLTYGAPMSESRRVREALVDAAQRVIDAHERDDGEAISQGVFSMVGASIIGSTVNPKGGGSHEVSVIVSLVPGEARGFSGAAFAKEWRQLTGDIAGLEHLVFSGETSTGGAASAIQIELSHPSERIGNLAAEELAVKLARFEGVEDINDGFERGKPQFDFHVTQQARSLGLTDESLANQVRARFFGVEALRFQRDRSNVKVMVRLPEKDRNTLDTLDNMTIHTPGGGEIPFVQAAIANKSYSYAAIRRSGGTRIIPVTANVDESSANQNAIVNELQSRVMPDLVKKFPGLRYRFEGDSSAKNESLVALMKGLMLSLFFTYALLAIPFKSFSQPLIVMLSIPFGVVGAILGHYLLGYQLSISSLIGIVALSGVVINDSLVLVVTANSYRIENALSSHDAVIKAAVRRLRPILLTSLTTFFGLLPMLLETSLRSRFLIPMAISIGFGILFATLVILILVPSIYLVLEDVKTSLKSIGRKRMPLENQPGEVER